MDYSINFKSSNFINLRPTSLLPLLSYQKNNLFSDLSPNKIYFTINNLKNIRNKIPKDFISSLQSHAKNCNINTFHFIMGEIMGNMEDHSNGSKCCVMAEYYDKYNELDLCFIDNGISIPNNFNKYNISFKDDFDAVYNAINGKSTKNINSNYYERGSGLNNCINIVTNGYKGSVLIASKNALVSVNNKKTVNKLILDNPINGTLISFRMKNIEIDNSDFYKCLEFIKF